MAIRSPIVACILVTSSEDRISFVLSTRSELTTSEDIDSDVICVTCKFEIDLDGSTHEINGMLALISLGLAQNTTGVLRVKGDEEEQAIEKICALLEFEFDFPQNK